MSDTPLTSRASTIGRWLRRRAENVMVALLSVMFATFIIQIFARYVLNNPVGWSEESHHHGMALDGALGRRLRRLGSRRDPV